MDKPELNIMLIDDDELTNHIHQTILDVWAKGKVKVQAYIKAGEVLERLQVEGEEFFPDCIFLDLNMPEMDGWTFLEEYKKLGIDVPIYVLSSSIQYSDKSRANSHPSVAAYLTKPLNIDTLNQLGLEGAERA